MKTARIVYVEGPDGAGKTELIKNAINRGDSVIHNGPYESRDKAFKAYMKQLADAKKAISLLPDITVYIDRGPISELIYGNVIRKEQLVDDRLREFMEELNKMDAMVIICLPDIEVSKANWASRIGSEYVKDVNRYDVIYQRYTEYGNYLADYKGNWLIYDYTTMGK